MGDVGHLVGHHGAADAAMLGPAVHARLEERAVHDQLTAAFEEVEQARFSVGAIELVLLLHGQPGHSPTLGGERVAGTRQLLLFHEQLLPRRLPLLQGNDWWRVHDSSPFLGVVCACAASASRLMVLSRRSHWLPSSPIARVAWSRCSASTW